MIIFRLWQIGVGMQPTPIYLYIDFFLLFSKNDC